MTLIDKAVAAVCVAAAFWSLMPSAALVQLLSDPQIARHQGYYLLTLLLSLFLPPKKGRLSDFLRPHASQKIFHTGIQSKVSGRQPITMLKNTITIPTTRKKSTRAFQHHLLRTCVGEMVHAA